MEEKIKATEVTDWKAEEEKLRRIIYDNGEELCLEEDTPHEIILEMLEMHGLIHGTLTTPIYTACAMATNT